MDVVIGSMKGMTVPLASVFCGMSATSFPVPPLEGREMYAAGAIPLGV